MEMTIIGILVFLIACAAICLFIGYYRYTKLTHKPAMNCNNIHFYIARDKNTLLYLYLGKPKRSYYSFTPCKNGYCFMSDFQKFGLNPKDFENLKFEDEPVEVFLNLE